jgi:hypothetical protein
MSVESSVDNLRYSSECLKGEAKVVFALEATRRDLRYSRGYDGIVKQWTRIAAETGMPFIDLNRVFHASGLRDDDLFLPMDPRHPSARGHKIYASALVAPVMSQAPEFFTGRR